MKNQKNKLVHYFIIWTFVSLYLLVSVVSTIHVIDFFKLSNPTWLAITLAIGFELGAAASLASIIVLDKMNKTLIWGLFIIITLMQMQGNTYHSFSHIKDYQQWSELFNLIDDVKKSFPIVFWKCINEKKKKSGKRRETGDR